MRKSKHAKEKRGKRIKEGAESKVNYSVQIFDTLRRRKKMNKIKNTAFIILFLIFVGSVFFVGLQYYDNYKIEKENQILKNNISENIEIQEKEDKHNERIAKVQELQSENSDIVGWLEIEGTNISYPVLQGEDNAYYMTHNYKKEKSKDGSLFLDKDYNWDKPSTNLLIYGHNNRGSKEMFVDLLNYKQESFYKEHKNIRFTTSNEDAEYEIIGAFLSRVYYKHEKDVFRYYFFIDANNKEEFDSYVGNCKKASLYETGVTAEYGDQLITLSTCEFSQTDGRFAVVARKK